jgi:hypothetical protein
MERTQAEWKGEVLIAQGLQVDRLREDLYQFQRIKPYIIKLEIGSPQDYQQRTQLQAIFKESGKLS